MRQSRSSCILTFISTLSCSYGYEYLKALAKSKLKALLGAKKLIDRWVDSPNKPSDAKIEHYVLRVIEAGESSIKVLRRA